jgi:organic hydroperoxide reductase OsmC/OhrA
MSIYKSISKGSHDNTSLIISSEHKVDLEITPPPEFKGPIDKWSPEDLFSASISSCYLLTFKALARSTKLDWREIEVSVNAHLEKTENGLKFTRVEIFPRLTICCQKTVDKYLEVLEKAKTHCLVTSSMSCEFTVIPKVIVKAK